MPLLMDCSAIDGKNPLIMQWVVFALRNLCEDNLENQQIIAKMEGKGEVVTNLAEEFGIKLNVNN